MLNLITFNRWWDTGKVADNYLKSHKRPLFNDLMRFLDTRQILLVYGLRRVGKTTLLYQIIDTLLKKGVNKKHIFYFSFDEKIASLKELFSIYSETVLENDLLKQEKVYVFLDEIQKLNNWQNQLKIFYDLYPNIKFLISGSASLIISKSARESLAGRIYEFILPLLSFSEYLNLLGESVLRPSDIFNFTDLKNSYLQKDRIAPFFFSYLKNGGFIEIATEKDDAKIKEYTKSMLEKVVFSDIPLSFNIKQPQILKSIVEIIVSNPGFLLDYSKLSETLSKDQRVIANYIFYLKYSLLVKILYNFTGSKFASERKLKKIYLASTNFIYQISPEKFNDPGFLGKIVENLIASFLPSEFFWRQKQYEVDLVLQKKIPVEVKYKKHIYKDDLKGILKFCSKFRPEKAIIVTKDEFKKERINDTEFSFVPTWLFLLCNMQQI